MMMIKDDQCTRVSEANAVINDRRKARQGLLDHFQTTLEDANVGEIISKGNFEF